VYFSLGSVRVGGEEGVHQSSVAVAAGLLVCEIGVWVSQASEIVQMNLIPLGKELLFE
jgi:hypothetical protein